MKDWLVILGLKKKPRDPNAPRYADLYERSIAAMIDLGLIYFALNRIVFLPMNRFFLGHVDQMKLLEMHSATSNKEILDIVIASGTAKWWLINSFAQLFVVLLIMLAGWVFYGTTPGKWLLGIRIVRRDLSREVARWRYAVRIAMLIPASLVAGIGIVWSVFNKERRGWHDIVAGTVVIHTRPEWWYWHQFRRGVVYVWKRLRKTR